MTKFSKDFRVKLVMEVDQGASLNSVAQKYKVGISTLKIGMQTTLMVV